MGQNPYTRTRKWLNPGDTLLTAGRTQALKFLKLQFCIAALTAFLWLLGGTSASMAAAVGGGISLLGNAFFVYKTFAHVGATKAHRIASGFFLGEVGKMFIIVSAFLLIFKYQAFAPVPLFTGFLATQAVFWVAPFVFKRPIQARQA